MSQTTLPQLSQSDLDHMFQGLGEQDWRYFADRRVFFTGGTGFIGKWLLAALLDADRRLNLSCRIHVLTRSPEAFVAATPHLANAPSVTLQRGDVRDFSFPTGKFDIIVHAATDVVAQHPPMETFATCLDGTQRILDFAQACSARDLLLTSSGAVYGQHPSDITGVPETYLGAPDPTQPSSAYGEGKRVSEWLACVRSASHGLTVKIARIYAQVGPYLALNKHFAIGNFIGDALAGRPIIIQGDGTPVRSYLYAADTVIWLWAMITRSTVTRAWNVGGVEAVSIAELAQKIAKLLGSTSGIQIMKQANSARAPERYVPDVRRARTELRLPSPIDLDAAIVRTAHWYYEHRLYAS